MATKTINQKITITGGDEIARTLRDLARLGEQTFRQLAEAASKININLPTDQVRQQIQQLGQTGQQAFAQLAQAAQASISSINQVGVSSTQAAQGVTQVGTAARQTTQDIAAIGPAAQQSLGGVQQQSSAAASAIGNIGTSVKVVAATLTGLGAAFSGLAFSAIAFGRSASDAVIAIGRAADKSGQSLEQFQQMKFALQQLGLSSSEAESAIKKLTDTTKSEVEKAAEILKRRFNLRFPEGEAGLKALNDLITHTVRMSGNLAPKFSEALKFLAGIGAVGKDGLEQLRLIFEGLKNIPDAARAAEIATALFGEAGKKMSDRIRDGSLTLQQFLDDFKKLGLGISPEQLKVGEDFRIELERMKVAAGQTRTEMGLLFAEPLTPIINAWTTSLRQNQQQWLKLAESLKNLLIPVLEEITQWLLKPGEGGTSGIEKITEAFEELGQAVGPIWKNIIQPAFEGIAEFGRQAATALSEGFGVKVTPMMVAFGAALTALLGPIKAVGIALLALFGAPQSAAFDSFKEKLKSFGIDIDGIKQKLLQLFEDFKKIFAGQDAAVQNQWLVDLKNAVVEFTASIPAAIAETALLAAAFVRLVGPANAARIVAAQMSGALDLLRNTVTIIGLALVGFYNGLLLVGLALRGIAAVVGWPAVLAAGILAVVTNFERLSAILQPVADGLNKLLGFDFLSGPGLTVATIGLLTAAFIRLAFGVGLVQAALIALAASPAIAAILTLAAVIQDLNRKTDAAQKELEDINREFAETGDLERYTQRMEEFNRKKRELSGGFDVSSAWQRMQQEAERAIQGIVGASGQGADAVSGQWNRAAGRVVGGFREIRPGVFERIVTDAERSANKAQESFRRIRPGVFERIVTESKNAAAKVKEDVATVEQTVTQMRQHVAEAFRDLQTGPAIAQADALRDALNRVAEKAREALRERREFERDIKEARGEPKGDPRGGLERVFEALDQAGQRVTQFFKQDIPRAILPAIQTIFDAVESIIGTSAAKAAEQVPQIVQPFETATEQIQQTLVGTFETVDPFAPLVEKAKNAVAAIVQAFQQLGSGGAAAPGVGGGAPGEEGAEQAAGGGIAGALVTAFEQAMAKIHAVVTTAIQNIVTAFQQLGPQIEAAVTTAIQNILVAFQQLGPSIAAVLAQIAIVDPFQPLVQSAQNAVNFIIQIFAQLGQAVVAPFESMRSFADAAMAGIAQVIQTGFQSMVSVIQSVAQQIDAIVQQIIGQLQAAVAEAERLAAAAAAAASAASSASGGSGSGNFFGGYTGDIGIHRVAGVVHGGEYVEPARVVRQPGVRAFLETLRRVGDLRKAIRYFMSNGGGFSIGGYVNGLAGRMSGALMPGYAGGGLVTANSKPRNLGTLRLAAGNETFQVLADETTAFKLQRFARRQLMTSGGRAPVWER